MPHGQTTLINGFDFDFDLGFDFGQLLITNC